MRKMVAKGLRSLAHGIERAVPAGSTRRLLVNMLIDVAVRRLFPTWHASAQSYSQRVVELVPTKCAWCDRQAIDLVLTPGGAYVPICGECGSE